MVEGGVLEDTTSRRVPAKHFSTSISDINFLRVQLRSQLREICPIKITMQTIAFFGATGGVAGSSLAQALRDGHKCTAREQSIDT